MAAVAAFAYFTFEEARAGNLASLPILAALLCPVSMLLMMKLMHSEGKETDRNTEPRDSAVVSMNTAKEAS